MRGKLITTLAILCAGWFTISGLTVAGVNGSWEPSPPEAGGPAAVQTTLNPILDTTIDSASPDPRGGDPTLFVSFSSIDGRKRRALIRFDLSPIPAAATVTSARLTLSQTGANGAGSVNILAVRAAEEWHGTAAWPGPGTGTPQGSLPVDSASGQKAWDVTDHVNVWLRGTFPNWGFVLMGPEVGESFERAFGSAEAALAERPVLTVTYEVAAPTPTPTPTPTPSPTPTATPTPTPAPAQASLVVLGTEVNQGLPQYPLVAGKTTLVRIYTASSIAGTPVQVDQARLDVTRGSTGATVTVNGVIPSPIVNGAAPIQNVAQIGDNRLFSGNNNINFYVPGSLLPQDSYTFTARLYRCTQSQIAERSEQAVTSCPAGSTPTLMQTIAIGSGQAYSLRSTLDIRLLLVLPDWVAYERPLSEWVTLYNYLDDLARVFPVRDGWGNIGDAKGVQVALLSRQKVCDGSFPPADPSCGPSASQMSSDPDARFKWTLVQANPAGQARTVCMDSAGNRTPPWPAGGGAVRGAVPCQGQNTTWRYVNDGAGGFATQFVTGTFLYGFSYQGNNADPAYDLNNDGRIDASDLRPFVMSFSKDGGGTWLTDLSQLRPGDMVRNFIDTGDGVFNPGELLSLHLQRDLLTWMDTAQTQALSQYNSLNPPNRQVSYAGFIFWPGMDVQGTGPGQQWGFNLWAWLDGTPGLHQELGHSLGLVPQGSTNAAIPPRATTPDDQHSINATISDRKAFDPVNRKALANPISVMAGAEAGGIGTPYTNSLLEPYEYTWLFNSRRLPGALEAATPRSPAADEPQFSLTGRLGKDDSFEVFHSQVITGVVPTEILSGSAYSLVFLAAGGGVLSQDPIPVAFEKPDEIAHHGASVYHHETFLHVVRPFHAATAAVELWHGDKVLAHLDRPANPPTVSVHPAQTAQTLEGTSGLTGTVTFSWEGSHPDGAHLKYSAAYSADGGTSWTHLGTGIESTALAWDSTALPGSNNALIRVEASDGFNTASAVSPAPFPVAPKPPVAALKRTEVKDSHDRFANVTTSSEASGVTAGQPVVLRGDAFDLQDGVLEGAALRWSSDVDGDLGSGREIEVPLTPLRRHVITLVATNSAGLSSSSQAAVFVGSQTYLPFLAKNAGP